MPRIRDPIHDLVIFDEQDPADDLAWRLLDTLELQRLRRIKQLGVSEYIYPGATHTRFAHSIGVYHNARRILSSIKTFAHVPEDKEKEKLILIAALLHDVEHGPFSHAFESARYAIAQSTDGVYVEHEKLTSQLITSATGELYGVISSHPEFGEEDAAKISDLFSKDEPEDIYHAIISSSFDADRMDYIPRDRLMTGTRAGAIDEAWLLNNLTTYRVKLGDVADPDAVETETFAFNSKARQAAEDFLLARYRLFTNVYLHRATRGIEQLIKRCFLLIAERARDPSSLGLEATNRVARFFNEPQNEAETFRRLDDFVVWGTIAQIADSKDHEAAQTAQRILSRKKLACIDLNHRLADETARDNAAQRIREKFAKDLNRTVFEDVAPITAYGRVGSDTVREHKKIKVLEGGVAKEITELSPPLFHPEFTRRGAFIRFYFFDQDAQHRAEKLLEQ